MNPPSQIILTVFAGAACAVSAQANIITSATLQTPTQTHPEWFGYLPIADGGFSFVYPFGLDNNRLPIYAFDQPAVISFDTSSTSAFGLAAIDLGFRTVDPFPGAAGHINIEVLLGTIQGGQFMQGTTGAIFSHGGSDNTVIFESGAKVEESIHRWHITGTPKSDAKALLIAPFDLINIPEDDFAIQVLVTPAPEPASAVAAAAGLLGVVLRRRRTNG